MINLSEIKDIVNDAIIQTNEQRSLEQKDLQSSLLKSHDTYENMLLPKNMREKLSSNKAHKFITQITNDFRKNQIGMQILPFGDGASLEVAGHLSNIVRHIENISNAQSAYITALDFAARSGRGYYKIDLDVSRENPFQNDILIKRIKDINQIIIDPYHINIDGSDAKWCVECYSVSKEKWTRRYNKEPSNFLESFIPIQYQSVNSTFTKYNSFVVKYYCISQKETTAYLLEDGSVVDDLSNSFIPIKKKKTYLKDYLCIYIADGDEIVEKIEWDISYVPIIPVYGFEVNSKSKQYTYGVSRLISDLQMLHDFVLTIFFSQLAKVPEESWLIEQEQARGLEQYWTNPHYNPNVRIYKGISLGGTPLPPPQRFPGGAIPDVYPNSMQLLNNEIMEALGMYQSSLGAPSNEISGKAIENKREESETSIYNFVQNLSFSIRHGNQIILELIKQEYDDDRHLQILSQDGKEINNISFSSDPNKIPQPQIPIDGSLLQNPFQNSQVENQIIIDLRAGAYKVYCSSGVSYETKRQQTTETMLELFKINPTLMDKLITLFISNLDIPNSKEMIEKLQEGTIDPLQLQQLQQQLQLDQQQMQQLTAVVQQLQIQLQDKSQELQLKQMESEQKMQLELEKLKLREYEINMKRNIEQEHVTPTELKVAQLETGQQVLPNETNG